MRFTSGLPETLCGAGSTLAETNYLRARLPRLLYAIGADRLLDAPCGDFNWMAHVDLEGVEYIGVDASAMNIAAARARAPDREFIEMDIISGKLPAADAMLCRDFYQHIPNAMVFSALLNFLNAGIPWLIATTHDNEVNEDIAEAGMFRRTNLDLPPFRLPPPAIFIPDPPGGGHYLGAWHRDDVVSAIS